MKKKILCVLVSVMLTASLAACGGNNGDSSTEPPAGNQSTTESNNDNNNDNSNDNSGSETSTTSGDAVQVTYANWNLGTEDEDNLERQMIRQFNQNNDLIEIVISQNVDYSDYANSLNTLAASGDLPDIIMLQNIPQPYANRWLADITSIAAADSEWSDIARVLRDSAEVNGKIVAVPFAIHMFGALINVDAFNAANADIPRYGISLDDFESALRAVNQPQNGIVAIKSEGDMINWLPSTLNRSFGYFTFDGERYNLDSSEVATSFRKISEYRSNGLTFNSLSEDQLANFSATNDWEAWANGEAAVNFDGTWQLNQSINELNLNVEFMGLPNNLSVIVPDYFGITPTCQNQQQAFEVMKWMSYGKEGFLKRIELAEAAGQAYFSMPISTDSDLIARFTEYITVPGIKEVYADIDNAIVEPVKVIPGYGQSRWEAQTGLSIPGGDGETIENANIWAIINEATLRGLNFADYATRVNDLANEKFQEARSTMQ